MQDNINNLKAVLSDHEKRLSGLENTLKNPDTFSDTSWFKMLNKTLKFITKGIIAVYVLIVVVCLLYTSYILLILRLQESRP